MVLVIPRNKPVGRARGIVALGSPAGSEEETRPCMMEVTRAGVASGNTRRWRAVMEKIQVSKMKALVANRKVCLADVFGLSFMLL